MAEVPVERHHDSIPPADAVAVTPRLLTQVSWGAIFAGTFIAIGVTMLLGLLGLAIGFSAIDPRSGQPFDGVGVGTAIWWILTSMLALAIGGFVAARLSGQPRREVSTAHGATVWALASLATFWIASSAIGTAVNTAMGAVGTAVNASATAIGTVGGAVIPNDLAAATGITGPSGDLTPEARRARDQIRQEAASIFDQAGLGERDLNQAGDAAGSTAEAILRRPGTAGAEIDGLVDRLFEGPGAVISPAERQRLVQALAQRAGVTPQEAEAIANRWEREARNAMAGADTTIADVREAAGDASVATLDALSDTAWYAFWAGLLSLIAAVAAAGFGAPQRGPVLAEGDRVGN